MEAQTAGKHPQHGFTRLGHPVHALTRDHHPAGSAYERFNKKVALLITDNVGTMTCCWIFFAIALVSLPATLVLANVVKGSVFHILGLYVASAGLVLIVTWVAQSFLQLVLLPALMVGQNLQTVAADARAAKTFEDIEKVKDDMVTALDRLDCETQGGVHTVLEAVEALRAELKGTPAAS